MIRLPRHGPSALRSARRRRISNQLAAFAAIMLFASTQIPTPEAGGPADTDFAVPVGADRVEAHADVAPVVASLEHTEQEAPSLESTGAAGHSPDARGLNLSLFLLRR